MSNPEHQHCFFFGVYPEAKAVPSDRGEFVVYSAELENLDHVVIREVQP
ncbi:MAG: hypothetical protein MJA27_00275 [Pseudanabaenales cyanobacterium]|nr:hypothetical protein [Pseudanabaenales cyanobacterium]